MSPTRISECSVFLDIAWLVSGRFFRRLEIDSKTDTMLLTPLFYNMYALWNMPPLPPIPSSPTYIMFRNWSSIIYLALQSRPGRYPKCTENVHNDTRDRGSVISKQSLFCVFSPFSMIRMYLLNRTFRYLTVFRFWNMILGSCPL